MTAQQIELPRNSDAPAMARQHVEERYRHQLSASAAADAAVVVSELATNALLHGRGRILLGTELHADRLRIHVSDEGSGKVPNVIEQPENGIGGWGLRVVDALASRWGVFEGSTHVWAELARD